MSSNKRPDHLLGWSDEENATLLRLKSQYDSWRDIHKLNLFPNRSPAAVQVQYSRLKNGRPRHVVAGQARGRAKRPGTTMTSPPNIAPLKRSVVTDSSRQSLGSPKRSRKSRRFTDGVDYQDHSSSEGEDLPWDCNTEAADHTPSQTHRAQGWLERTSSSSVGTDYPPVTPTIIKPGDTSQIKSVPSSHEETTDKPEAPHANLPSGTRLSPPERFRATPAAPPAEASTNSTPAVQPQPTTSDAPDSLIAKLKLPAPGAPQPMPTSGSNSPAPLEPVRRASGFTSVNQASHSPSAAPPPQASAPPWDAVNPPSRTPSMPPPPSVPAQSKGTPPLTLVPQTKTTATTPPIPMASFDHIPQPYTAPTLTAQPTSTLSQASNAASIPQTAQTSIPISPASAPPKLPSTEWFNKANEYMSRGIDTIVEEMTVAQRSQNEKLILENKALQSSLSEVTAERDDLKNKLASRAEDHDRLVKEVECLKEERKGMEEYVQKIGEMSARFMRKE
ncbi:hypothetical protein BJY01DRAFT_227932 [Aspergillus pseudoustus]|uniref:Myb-like domain-containing protein n=1 Tax=Aspergillus pseudoustus TaxID=1810923 RepID=A0ABR4INN3_9EURO